MILFAVFLAAYTLSQFFRAFLAVIAPRLAGELGLTSGDLANMSAAWFAVFAFAQFPLGVALDRIGPRRTVPVLMLAGVAGAILLSRAQGATGCIVALALIGLGCSPIYMGALYYYGRTESPHRFGFISACMLGLGSLGNLLAATPLAYAAEQFGWRGTLFAIGIVMLGAAALFALLVRDPPAAIQPKAQASMLGRSGASLDASLPGRSGASPDASAFAELRQIVTLPGFWTLMPLITLGYAALVVERGLWVGPYFAEVHALGTVALGNAVLVMAVAMSAGALAFGWLDRAWEARKLLIVVGSVLCAVGFAVLVIWPRPPVALAVSMMALIGFMGLCQPLLFAHARLFFPEHLLGRGITFANFLTIGGAGVVQFASGAFVSRLLAQGTPAPEVYAALHLSFAALILAATLVYLWSAIPAAQPRAAE